MKYAFFLIVALPALHTARADVKMPAIFGDHMVLQQNLELPVWGTADPGEKVTVSFAGRQAQAVADSSGKWKVKLNPVKAFDEPGELTVSGKNTLVFKDVLAGDVWLCSGQSNMAFRMQTARNATEEIPNANHPQLRLFQVNKTAALAPVDTLSGKWRVCTPESVVDFSAVGYFFGREIQKTQKVPVGLIGSYWGGTPAEAWTSLEKIDGIPTLKHYEDDLRHTQKNLVDLQTRYESEALPKWKEARQRWEAKQEPRGNPPAKPAAPERNPNLATTLFNAMIHPLIPYGIKGVIWYQGEANANRAEEYAILFPALITDWRERWNEGNFPFLFVQLAGLKLREHWPELRDSQRRALSLPATGMVVTIDIGEEKDVHPKNKLDVGRRLALAARHVAYGENLVYSGPAFKSWKVEENKAVISFDHIGNGLSSAPDSELHAFEIAGTNGKFIPACAVIEGDTVVVTANGVTEPKAVRYAWANWPEPPANLYNKEGLPAVPFNTDEKK